MRHIRRISIQFLVSSFNICYSTLAHLLLRRRSRPSAIARNEQSNEMMCGNNPSKAFPPQRGGNYSQVGYNTSFMYVTKPIINCCIFANFPFLS